MKLEESCLQTNHHTVLETIHGVIADVRWNLSKYKESLEFYEKVLSGRERCLEENHLDTLEVMNDMANL